MRICGISRRGQIMACMQQAHLGGKKVDKNKLILYFMERFGMSRSVINDDVNTLIVSGVITATKISGQYELTLPNEEGFGVIKKPIRQEKLD